MTARSTRAFRASTPRRGTTRSEEICARLRLVITLAVATQMVAVAEVTAQPRTQDELVAQGRQLYADGCISCHGEQGEGEAGTGPAIGAGGTQPAGPPLRGVGAASVDFYLSTGYMPLEDPRARPRRGTPSYDAAEIEALVAYVDSLTIGDAAPEIPDVDPATGDVAEGLELFTDHCAGCHQVVGQGGIAAEAVAPDLEQATPTQVGEAIRVGPYTMPRFSEELISDSQVDSIAAYVEYTKDPDDEGGWGIGHIGPIPEGLTAWFLAALGLVGIARIIGKRITTEEG